MYGNRRSDLGVVSAWFLAALVSIAVLMPARPSDEVGNAREIAAMTDATIVVSYDLVNLTRKDKGAGFRAPVIFDGVTLQTKLIQPSSKKNGHEG